MEEVVKLVVGIIFLALAWPVGNWLASSTKEELKSAQRWINLIVYLGLLGGFVGMLLRKDVWMFTGFFISIVASRSLRG